MIRTLAVGLALAAGLGAAASTAAQPYPQPSYPDSRYDQPAPPPPSYDRPDDRSWQDRDSQPPPPRGGYDRPDDRGYGPPPPPRTDYRVDSTPPYPDRANGDRRYEGDPQNVDPAPGANGPYVGAGRRNFYDVDERIARIGSRLAALPASQRRRAYAEYRAIQAEERTQRDRHGGELRDWDREHLNQRLDALMRRYPWLGG